MYLDRSQAPTIVDFVIDKPLQPKVLNTLSGVTIHILQNTIQPVVRVEFVFKAGKWYQSKAGVASLTAKILKEGTIHKTAKQIADTIDFYGASLEVTHGFDRSTLTLYCLSKFLKDLLPLALEIIQAPSFPEEEFDILKQRVIQTLSVDKQKNSYLSSESFTSVIYGKDHPYSTFINEEDIAALTVSDLREFHSKAYGISTAEIFIAGDLHQEPLEVLLTTFQKNYLEEEKASQSLQFYQEKASVIELYKASPNTMQASVRIGKPFLSPTHDDYPGLYLLNHVFGGYFGSRLMKNIREDKGFTYGIYSSISIREQGVLFSIGTDIKSDKVKETLAEVNEELKKLTLSLVPDEELKTVKKHLAGKFMSESSTIFDKMDKYKATVLLNLPPSYFTNLQEKVNLLLADDLQRIAEKHFDYTSMYRIVVGGI